MLKFFNFLYIFISSLILISCIPSRNTNKLDLCYQYDYDSEKKEWVDDSGIKKNCSLYDYTNIFPLVNNTCDQWRDHYSVNSSEEENKEDEEGSFGYKIKFYRINIVGRFVCVKQEFIDLGGSSIPTGYNNQCLLPIKGNVNQYIIGQCLK